MSITVERKRILQALKSISHIVPQKSTAPIFKCVKCVIKDNLMTVEASNEQCSITKTVNLSDSDADGIFVFDCKMFTQYIQAIKDDFIQIVFHETDANVEIIHSKGTFTLPMYPSRDYPLFSELADSDSEIVIPSAILSDTIRIAKNFISSDILRPQLMCIYAYVKDGVFGYASTDTRIMVHDHENINERLSQVETNWLIHPMLFSSLLDSYQEDCDVKIDIYPNHERYTFGTTMIKSVKIKGNYPDFRRVIPQNSNVECSVDVSEMLESLNRIILSGSPLGACKVQIDRFNINLMASDDAYGGKSIENLQHNGCNGEISFNVGAAMFAKCLSANRDTEAIIKVIDPSRPIVISQPQKPNLVTLCMPMNIS